MRDIVRNTILTEDKIIRRYEYKNIHYNTKVSCRDATEIVVITSGVIRRLNALDEGIINPKKLNIFSDKVDHRKHIVYLIDKSVQDANWGGSIIYKSVDAHEDRYRVYIRAKYNFIIDRGNRCIELLNDLKDSYDKRYLIFKIRAKMDLNIKTYVESIISKYGYKQVYEAINTISENLMAYLNEEVLLRYGIKLVNFSLMIEQCEI